MCPYKTLATGSPPSRFKYTLSEQQRLKLDSESLFRNRRKALNGEHLNKC